ncbi:hypothetical protein HG536_0C06330 [Torulaspora globosa]|uniref:Sulfite reductase [NADPH] subunit beta n=1 Tax=Torulaspora globosa TaxID=48254 RepID=A0A7G3ZG28_9SACH|nr:uncharacterized protein HG536_0C06330 [Torulaspora globosa]QLL32464.1 hypothetical protein HG536_0C06330 [Torulaspora globosa]
MTTSSISTITGALIKFAQAANPSSRIFYTVASKATKSELTDVQGSIRLLSNCDPFSEIIEELKKDSFLTVFTEELTLLKALPHLQSLKGFAIVVNIDLKLQDYSVITAFKDLSIPILVSSNGDAALKNAKIANETATQFSEPVFHFINYSKATGKYGVEPAATELAEEVEDISNLNLESFELYNGPSGSPSVLIVNLSPYGYEFTENLPCDTALLDIKAYRPWNKDQLWESVPSSVRKIVIVQSSCQRSNARDFEPLLLDFFDDFDKLIERNIDNVLLSKVGELKDVGKALREIVSNAKSEKPDSYLFLGDTFAESSDDATELSSSIKGAINLENAYLKVLKQLFSSNLEILNEYSSPTVLSNNPEYGYGFFLSEDKKRQELLELAKNSLDPSLYHSVDAPQLVEQLSKWITYNESNLDESALKEANDVGNRTFELLELNQESKTALDFLKIGSSATDYSFKSRWLIGSDAWSYDLGNSGVHQTLFSKKNLNILLIDSEPYKDVSNSHRRKKDVGLYAMNAGDVYVASVAVYSSYTQLLTALIEASKFNGPSIVLAYLPYRSETDTPIEVLKETKNAVESGYWPLYRYNPSIADEEEKFKLDSAVIKRELQNFLDRENKLTLLSKRDPDLARNLKQSASDVITAKQEKRSKLAYDQLLDGLSGPPLHIYYASDGGNASALAKRLGTRAAARGLKSTVLSMEDIIFEELPGEENVIFITSTAGQGEFPQDGKAFWDFIKSTTDLDLASLNFGVFGLGDSQYWPRKEDKHYYNRPATQLFKRLELLTAKPLLDLGLGDDQDADGYHTGYGPWEAELWKALGVANAAVPDEPKPWNNEDMKLASNFLRGTIVEGLADESTGAIHAYDQQLTKFHGIYMQDDRDIRETRKAQGLEPYYIFMARVRLPGGIATPEQWLVLDRLSDETGNGTIKLTTRATFQLHGVVKRNLKHTIRAMNSTLMDTLAACGDVNRNVMVSALPGNAKVHAQVSEIGAKISEFFLPKTTAYHEIWLSGTDERDYNDDWSSIFENRKEGPTKKKTLVGGNALVDVEPLYTNVYLPRKFKVNITVPPYNDVDVWASDVGLIAIIDNNQQLTGFNMYVGGGMGTTHNNKKTYPRLGSSFGFVSVQDTIPAIEAVMIVQRDNGDRENRKHARLKYTVDDMGPDVFKKKVEEITGKKFLPEKAYQIDSNQDYFGWVKDETGLNHFTVFVENGRVEDTVNLAQKTGFRKIAQLMQKNKSGHFRLTGNQHALICGIKDEHLDEYKKIMKRYNLDNTDFSGLRLSSASCVGLPTCGLAMAESERYMPLLITKLENILEEYGLRHDSVVMRMTGCPNGCARPWLAEVALIGKAPDTYNMMLGGGFHGQRLNKLYRASIKEHEIVTILTDLFRRWALERNEGEHFGDFVIRVGLIKPTTEGKYFHDDVAEEAL